MSLLKMSQPMQVLVSTSSVEWYTPREIVERVRTTLGSITLDPASDSVPQAWIRAERYFTLADDGLSKPWFGNVYLNPPYCGNAAKWAAKLIDEYQTGRVEQAIMLVNSAHGYRWYESLWTSFPVCCLRDRLRFIKPNGEAGGQAKKGQTLVYFGRDVYRFARGFGDLGRILFPMAEVEKITCGKPNCKTPVADRRADGAIIRCVRHRGRWHITIIMPSREKLSLPGWKRGIERIRCDETNCTIVVAERRADGTVILRDEHHEQEHVTIIEPLKPVTESCFEER